jgi:hypothetical protein
VRFLELSGEARSKIVELVRKIAYLDDDEESGGPVGQA